MTKPLKCNKVIKRQRMLGRGQLKPDGTRWRTGGEVKGKLANGVGSQYSHATSEHGVSSITTANAHNSAASSRLNWRPRRLKWTRPFRRKIKYGFCACAITFQTQSSYQRLGTTSRSHLHVFSNPRMQCLALGDGTDTLSRNVDN
jgi:hypothetical protein